MGTVVSFSMDQQRDNMDLVYSFEGLTIGEVGWGDEMKGLDSIQKRDSLEKKDRKVSDWNQDTRTHPVMREELDLSWDDVRAEAEQRNVGQTVNQNRHFGK